MWKSILLLLLATSIIGFFKYFYLFFWLSDIFALRRQMNTKEYEGRTDNTPTEGWLWGSKDKLTVSVIWTDFEASLSPHCLCVRIFPSPSSYPSSCSWPFLSLSIFLYLLFSVFLSLFISFPLPLCSSFLFSFSSSTHPLHLFIITSGTLASLPFKFSYKTKASLLPIFYRNLIPFNTLNFYSRLSALSSLLPSLRSFNTFPQILPFISTSCKSRSSPSWWWHSSTGNEGDINDRLGYAILG